MLIKINPSERLLASYIMQVVLFGHHTGASSLGYFMLNGDRMPYGKWKRFILHSGSPFRIFRDNSGDKALSNLRGLAANVSCGLGNLATLLACLRNLSAREISRAASNMGKALGPTFGPSFDLSPIGISPFRASSWTFNNDLEVLVGGVAEEGRFELNVLLQTYLKDTTGNDSAIDIQLRGVLDDFFAERGLNNGNAVSARCSQ